MSSEDASGPSNKKRVIHIEHATSARAHCKECTCLGQIKQGEMRIGVPMFQGGRITTGWFHPKCFCSGLSVEISQKGNGGLCKMSKAKLGRGSFRALVRSGNASFGLGLKGAVELLHPALKLAGVAPKAIPGTGDLPGEIKMAWISGAISKKALEPVVLDDGKKAAGKKKAAAGSPGKKGKTAGAAAAKAKGVVKANGKCLSS